MSIKISFASAGAGAIGTEKTDAYDGLWWTQPSTEPFVHSMGSTWSPTGEKDFDESAFAARLVNEPDQTPFHSIPHPDHRQHTCATST